MKRVWIYTAALSILWASEVLADDITLTSYDPIPYGRHGNLSAEKSSDLAYKGGSVTVGSPAATPANDAVLDIISSDKGVLFPRLPKSVIEAGGTLANPGPESDSLLIFNEDETTPVYKYYDAEKQLWLTLDASAEPRNLWELTNDETGVRNQNSGSVGIGKVPEDEPSIGNALKKSKFYIYNRGMAAISDNPPNNSHADSVPISGAGTRFMWVPSGAALRIGSVSGDQFDRSKIGSASFAFGRNVEATALDSIAIGTAKETDAGYTISKATSTAAIALAGGKSEADYSIAIGNNTVVSGSTSIAIGHNLGVSSSDTIAIGNANTSCAPGTPGCPPLINAHNTVVFVAGKPVLYVHNPTPSISRVGIGIQPTLGTTNVLEIKGHLKTATLNTASDVKLKSDITKIDHSLDKLARIRPVRFAWNDLGFSIAPREHPQDIGLIAQDLENVFPELVSTRNGYRAIDYEKLNVVILAAIKDLAAENERLYKNLENLKKAAA